MAATKRKRASMDASKAVTGNASPPPKRTASARQSSTSAAMNPNINEDIIDAPIALRASPDGDVNEAIVPGPIKEENTANAKSKTKKIKKETNEVGEIAVNGVEPDVKEAKATKKNARNGVLAAAQPSTVSEAPKRAKDEMEDPEADGDEEANEEEVKEALTRPPPVHSDNLPLPWKGRLRFAS